MSGGTAPTGPAAAGPARFVRRPGPRIEERELPPARYSYGGDEFLFVELSEEMSFRANFKARAILQRLEQRELPGLIDLCPNSTSYLIRFDPDQLAPDALVRELKSIESTLGDPADFHFRSRVIDVPILYDDPWSTECLMRYRDRHQDPSATDLEYMARINGFRSVPELIEAHAAAPYLVMGVGFTPACYWSVAMVPREKIIVAPTYIRPRLDTPERTFSHGGCFAAIYPSPGPGGYQLIGMAPAPIFDPAQALPDFADSPVFTRTGDIFKHRPIDRSEYDALRAEVEAGTFRYTIREHDVEPGRFFEDPAGFVDELLDEFHVASRSVEVLHGGLSTTVQDAGRHGLYSLGMPPSGAMDDFSARVANLLVGNGERAAVLELTYMGPRLGFRYDAVVAVTGADMPPSVDGSPRPGWEAFEVKAGETLDFDHLRDGARCYVAVAGGFDVPEVLGSRSTFARVSLGGYQGRALVKGDVLAWGTPPRRARGLLGARIDEADRPRFARALEVRIVLGLYSHRLTPDSLADFLATDWTVTPSADRVGYRYRGIELKFVERDEVPFGVGSSPWNTCSLNYPCGVIQLPGGVEPIVLMKDGVTGGNYASVGTVITADLDRVAQSKTHETTRFVPVSLDEALEARSARRRKLSRIHDRLADSRA